MKCFNPQEKIINGKKFVNDDWIKEKLISKSELGEVPSRLDKKIIDDYIIFELSCVKKSAYAIYFNTSTKRIIFKDHKGNEAKEYIEVDNSI
ncbi:MAG: hypothetical protein PF487_11855 [Bacteroidales bacterium]|jgi:hypothetical protein|nr:hypothetical protein [Bacteroidales bacterium]